MWYGINDLDNGFPERAQKIVKWRIILLTGVKITSTFHLPLTEHESVVRGNFEFDAFFKSEFAYFKVILRTPERLCVLHHLIQKSSYFVTDTVKLWQRKRKTLSLASKWKRRRVGTICVHLFDSWYAVLLMETGLNRITNWYFGRLQPSLYRI